ncbi:hypothetical protein DYB25_005755 [Aphanomyces astaci]|uniref:Aspartic peptidase DDI1-type domain-containing protein n=1 Tax=Aphanomyces astaci TaxID=112090 RepID=A0A397B522_APHAT|nr:hypothetical protein DYB25_005755 [Aphanomyces astaci]RHY66459.1 hypothetical protein DYB30_004488 [Aphanomyces astaci]RHZ07817.1 hypothetical protein DYB26_004701 [Aphanomyces astaci]RHZ14450.1 hypothetical protein DYB31_005930 [Aphanomyces astaci]
MQLTVGYEDTFIQVEVDAQDQVENIKALIEAQIEEGNPSLAQSLKAHDVAVASCRSTLYDLMHVQGVRMALMKQHMDIAARKYKQDQEALELERNPFSEEAQVKIEEAIRLGNVQHNMEIAMEEMPEAFGRVHMLYISTVVNNMPVKAFVDSGAQSTIMSSVRRLLN